MGNGFVELTWQEFEEQFKPIKNFFREDEDEQMFETYGEEVEFVKSESPDRIWTYTQVERGCATYNGWHFVNRIGYFITENPFDPDITYQIDFQGDVCDQCERTLSEDEEYDDNGCCVKCSQDAEFIAEQAEAHK